MNAKYDDVLLVVAAKRQRLCFCCFVNDKISGWSKRCQATDNSSSVVLSLFFFSRFHNTTINTINKDKSFRWKLKRTTKPRDITMRSIIFYWKNVSYAIVFCLHVIYVFRQRQQSTRRSVNRQPNVHRFCRIQLARALCVSQTCMRTNHCRRYDSCDENEKGIKRRRTQQYACPLVWVQRNDFAFFFFFLC